MDPLRVRAIARPRYQHDVPLEMVSRFVPALKGRLETLALGLVVSAFWALVLFAAITVGMH